MDNNAQGSAELILLLGGMIIIVLVILQYYKSYLLGITNELNSSEVSNFNNKLDQITYYFN